MARVLDVRYARVSPAQQPAYRAAVAALAARLERGEAHVWVFRSRDDPDEFLEFVEGRGGTSPRAAVTDPGARDLLEQLQHLARYHDQGTVWEAVSLTSGASDGAKDR